MIIVLFKSHFQRVIVDIDYMYLYINPDDVVAYLEMRL